jgi:uncharacterized protein (TIGR03086 family)
MIDLEPATTTLTRIVEGLRDDQLSDRTPCLDTSVADLLDHVDGFSLAFTAAANKTTLPGEQAPTPDGSNLGKDWRERIPSRLAALAEAWREDAAWTGMTRAGGQDLPGEVAGVIALDEVVIHSWDLAVATGQPFSCEPALVDAVHGFVQPFVAQHPEGIPNLFGPAVPVSDDAPPFDRLLGLTGRDPAWK